jgi:hypothetical protein
MENRIKEQQLDLFATCIKKVSNASPFNHLTAVIYGPAEVTSLTGEASATELLLAGGLRTCPAGGSNAQEHECDRDRSVSGKKLGEAGHLPLSASAAHCVDGVRVAAHRLDVRARHDPAQDRGGFGRGDAER